MADICMITGKINTYGDFFRYSTFIRRGLELFYAPDKNPNANLSKAADVLSKINDYVAERLAPFVLTPDDYALYSCQNSSVKDKRILGTDEERSAKFKNITQNLADIVAATEISKIPKEALDLEVLEPDKFILEETVAISIEYLTQHLKKVGYAKRI